MKRSYKFEKARQAWMETRIWVKNKQAQAYIDGIVTILDRIYNKGNFFPNDSHLMDLQSVVGMLGEEKSFDSKLQGEKEKKKEWG